MPPKASQRRELSKLLERPASALGRLFRSRSPTPSTPDRVDTPKSTHNPSSSAFISTPEAAHTARSMPGLALDVPTPQGSGKSIMQTELEPIQSSISDAQPPKTPIATPRALDLIESHPTVDSFLGAEDSQELGALSGKPDSAAHHTRVDFGVPTRMPSMEDSDQDRVHPRLASETLTNYNHPPQDSGLKDLASAAVRISRDALRSGMSLVPSLRSAIGVLTDCIDNVPAAVRSREGYNELASDVATAVGGLEEHLSQLDPGRMANTVVNTIDELKKQAEHIKSKQERTAAKSYVEAEEDIDDLIRRYRRIEVLLRQLQNDAILSIWRLANESVSLANESQINDHLRNLDPVKTARYNSSAASQVKRSVCTPRTRQLVLQGLRDWAGDPNGAKVYWMNGMAGTGKTTIAYSLCSQLEASHQLGASFFCSRSLPDCRDVGRIVPTIVYQLARFCRSFKDALYRILRDDPDIGDLEVMTQFEKLISEPLQQAGDTIPRGLLVVVIDALDECSDRTDASLVLDALLRFAKDLPIKFFVTCRPDSNMLHSINAGGNLARSLYHLHDIEQSLVQADIETYLRSELEPIRAGNAQIKQLAEQSGRLFIYAATAVRYIRAKTVSINPLKRLDAVLGMSSSSSSSSKAYEPLDKLYTAILSAALENEELEQSDTDNIRLALYTIMCAREPLNISTLAYLLQMESTGDALRAVEPLQSVLHLDERSGVVSILHLSFPNYMQAGSRSGRFCCDIEKSSLMLARQCFAVMKQLLRFNMCDLESSYMLDTEVPDLSNRVSKAIPLHLYYACRYWSDHMTLAGVASELSVLLDDFMRQRVLFWTEAMNLKRLTKTGVLMMSDSYKWMQKSSMSNDACAFWQDAQKFVAAVSSDSICESTPHMYVSVLALWDRRAPMWAYYGAQLYGLVKATGTALDCRQPTRLAGWEVDTGAHTISVSRDGRLVASGSLDGTVCVRDARTGYLVVGPLKGHTDWVRSVTFSPDGSCVASGSDDSTIRIWDARTGREVLGPIKGHTDWVPSIAYSPDGKCLASGSGDRTVRIWDTHTGTPVVSPLKGHTNWVHSVAYSSDGKRIVSGSEDQTICVWNAESGHLLLGLLFEHTRTVRMVKYSPDDSRIASSSDDGSVQIWDAHTGQPLASLVEKNSNPVRCLSYSTDGERIASGSDNGIVGIWDVQAGQLTSESSYGSDEDLNSIAFMPNSDLVVFSTSRRICMWDTKSEQTASSASAHHSRAVYSVAFSPDSTQIVSGFSDHTVSIWDAQTGKQMAGPFTEHMIAVNSVAFAPCGRRVVSGSSDHTVLIWDSQTGRILAGPCQGHTDSVSSVCFSPDGSRVASGSFDGTIRVWDAQSGQLVAGPFTGHTGGVWSVAYSPDGSRIASTSDSDGTRVWDAVSGARVAGPFEGWSPAVTYSHTGRRLGCSNPRHAISLRDTQTWALTTETHTGHTDWVRSIAFSPDDSWVISGSDDCTIYIWDAHTGSIVVGPFKAHIETVRSVSFSPNGRLIASCSDDGSIRVWDFQSLVSPVLSDHSWWSVNNDVWVTSHTGKSLFGVPPELQVGLKWPQTVSIIGAQKLLALDFTDAYLGTEWTKCFGQ